MDLKFCSIDELKALRPDLYQAIEQEVILGKWDQVLGLNKEKD